MKRKYKIGIDARFYGPKGKGLGRYVQKLIKYLEEIDGQSDREYYIFLRNENFHEYVPLKSNFKKVKANFRWYSLSEQMILPFFLDRYKLDLMHFTHFNVPILYRSNFIVTIHDLILFHYPTVRNTTLNKYYYFLKLFVYKKVISSAARRARQIISVSEFTRQDVIKNLSVEGEKVITTLEGCDGNPQNYQQFQIEQVFQKYGIIKPYLLYVGNAYPHKNLEGLCRAFSVIKENHPEMNLVLVGGRDFFYKRLAKFLSNQKIHGVHITGFVQEQDLDIIYKESMAYVFPSLYEGFGLPPLEALSRGVPVVSSSRTSMPEVLGESVIYFDPEDINSMAEAIERVVSSEKTRQEIISYGLQRVKNFSWRKMAQLTLDAYKNSIETEKIS